MTEGAAGPRQVTDGASSAAHAAPALWWLPGSHPQGWADSRDLSCQLPSTCPQGARNKTHSRAGLPGPAVPRPLAVRLWPHGCPTPVPLPAALPVCPWLPTETTSSPYLFS